MNPTLFDLLSEPSIWVITFTILALIWGLVFIVRP